MNQVQTCPACSSPMARQNFGSIHADVCGTGCARIWFDADELERVNHHSKGAGPALEAAAGGTSNGEELDTGKAYDCPRCKEPLDRIEYELEKSVIIDECPNCAGVLLDPGELEAIRNRKLTAKEFRRVRRRRLKRKARMRAREEAARMNASAAVFLILFTY